MQPISLSTPLSVSEARASEEGNVLGALFSSLLVLILISTTFPASSTMINDLVAILGLASPSRSSRNVSQLLRLLELLPVLRSKSFLKSNHLNTAIRLFYAAATYRLLALIKKYMQPLFIRRATLSGPDHAFRWMWLFLIKQPSFRTSPASINIVADLVRQGLDARCIKDQGEVQTISAYKYGTEAEQEKRLIAEKRESESGRGIFFVPTSSNKKMYFWHNKTLFWAVRERNSTIALSCLSLSTMPMTQLMKHVRQEYLAYETQIPTQNQGVKILFWESVYGWKAAKATSPRPLGSIHLPAALKADIINDARDFYTEEKVDLYRSLHIPYRRGLLFHGPPGTGKSSLCQALATELGEPICILQLASSGMNDSRFMKAMKDLPPRCILLIEDIDAAYVKRDARGKTSVSFDVLLNSLDGVYAAQGRLLLITTNHIDRLDKALLREGRIDKKYEIKNANREQMKELFIRWFTTKSINATEELHSQADAFAESISEYEWSIAVLQGFLMECDNDSQKAVGDIEGWLKKKSK
jgi:chaperone BCS1